MRLIVCGGRNYKDRGNVFRKLDQLHRDYRITEVIDGACTNGGADLLAHQWAMARKINSTRVPANWQGLGRRAGMARNHDMLRMQPDAVAAFPGGTGTRNMVDIALKAGIRVFDYRFTGNGE
jgi:hypothetical protein